MWKCKECGGEVLKFNIVIESYRMDENYDEVERDESFDDSTDESYFECVECGKSDKEDRYVYLEDIAEWVE